jgi:hypothetical protein
MERTARTALAAVVLGLGLAALLRYTVPPPRLPSADSRQLEPAPPSSVAGKAAASAVRLDGSFGEIHRPVSVDEGFTHFALGRSFLEHGDYYAAASHLAAAREGLGNRAHVCELLARTYDKLNMTLDLLEVMPCLAEAARERPSASRLYDRLSRQTDVEEAFLAAASDHFVASFPASGPSAASIGEVLEMLERARSRVDATTGLASRRLVPVVLYEADLFDAAIDKPHWAAGLYDGKIRLHMDAHAENPLLFEVALTHEYVHALTHEHTGTRLPNWFREGLADVLARATTLRRDTVTRPLADHDELLGLDALSESFGDLAEERAVLAYRQSYWMVQNLTDEAGWEPLADLVRDLGRNPDLDFAAGFYEIYGESPSDYLDRFAALRPR